MPSSRAVRTVAVVEGLKGVLVLLAGSGLLALMHHDVHALAASLIEHAHLNPAARYPRIFLDASLQLTDARLWQLAAGAALYTLLRFIEAYGLYRERAWAEMLAAASGGIYIPFELYELARTPSLIAAALLVLNLLVVGVMLAALLRRRRPATRP